MNKTMFDLDGKTALVTGGSRGLGQAMAIGLAEAGATVGATSRTLSALDETLALSSGVSGAIIPLEMDVENVVDTKSKIAAFANAQAGIDILVNNAGYEQVCPSLDMDENLWDKINRVNLKGAFFCAQETARSMIAHGGGSVINVCSLTSYVGVPTAVPYGSSKSGLLGMTRALSAEWASKGVRVNAIAPGYFRTELTDEFYKDAAWQDAMLAKIPMQSFGDANDLKGAVVFLASNASRYITGQCLAIDGGFLASI